MEGFDWSLYKNCFWNVLIGPYIRIVFLSFFLLWRGWGWGARGGGGGGGGGVGGSLGVGGGEEWWGEEGGGGGWWSLQSFLKLIDHEPIK